MLDDKDILDLFTQEDKRDYAFSLLVEKYSERLYWHIRTLVFSHDDADDLLQNTFIKVWKSLHSFREESKLYTWLYRIATNETLTFLKKERSKISLSMTGYEEIIDNTILSDPMFDGNKIQVELHKAIQKLPPKQRSVFVMRYFDEMKYEDISEVLSISVGALKASYHHAYQKILKSVEETN